MPGETRLAAPPTAPSTTWAHRPGLDGLRCLAVVVVIGFHSGITWLSNGYIGVDVFFVLSGYLVTTVVLQGGFDAFGYRTFYGRRVRRLLPAAVTAVVATCVALLLWIPRLSREDLIGDARAALLYVANWHFISQSTDYFATNIESSPFLHYWSLAIEEQFYLVYPLVLVGGYRLARRRVDAATALRLVGLAIGTLGVASLAAQAYWAAVDPTRAYLGTDARLYQLLVGAAAAIAVHARRHDGLTRVAAWAKPAAPLSLLCLAVLSTQVIDVSVSQRGVVAALVALVLVVSIDAAPTSPANRLLGRRTPSYLGQISYMVYLAHWPIILLLEEIFDVGALALAIMATLLSAGVAALSFELLEQPIRRGRLITQPTLTILLGLGTSLVAALVIAPTILQADVKPAIRNQQTVVVPATHTTPTPAPEPERGDADAPASTIVPAESPTIVESPEQAALAALLDEPVPDGLDFDSARVAIPGRDCQRDDPGRCIVDDGIGRRVHLIGDSNAAMLRPMLSALALEQGWRFSESTFQGCPWQRDLGTSASPPECYGLRSGWYDRVSSEILPDVVIAVGLDYGFEPIVNQATWVSVDNGSVVEPDSVEAMQAAFVGRTMTAIDALTSSGATVVLIEPIAYDANLDPTSCLSGASTVGECAFVRPEPSFVTLTYRDIAASRDDVVSMDLDELSCPDNPVCLPLIDDQIVFKDPTHLSVVHTTAQRSVFLRLLTETGALAD